jgi:diguanylate cyclase (GGDEF)-like protein
MYNKFIFFHNNKLYYYIIGGYLLLILLGFYFYKNIGNYEERLKNLLLSQTISSVENASSNIIGRMLQENPHFVYDNRMDIKLRNKNENKISDLLNDDISSVYVLYLKENQLFYLLDTVSEDRGEVNELYGPAQEYVFEQARQNRQTKTFTQPSIDELGFTLIKPIIQGKQTIAFLVLDYKESSLSTLSSLLNTSVTSLIYAIAFSLLILLLLISYMFRIQYIKYKMYRNPLTNTLNRIYLTDNYDKIDFKSYYVALVDLDFFKRVNNLYGQRNGDKILISIIRRITTLLRSEDLLIQYGGEEFLLLISKNRMSEHVFKHLLEDIRSLIEATNFQVKSDRFSLTISIGALLQTELEKSLQDAIHKADTALYKSKHNGRNSVSYFDLTQPERIYRENLKEMIESDKLVCYYQPIKRLKDSTLHHYEALLRIEDGDNVIFPDRILPAIEDSYLYSYLTKKIIEYNVKILRIDQQMRVSINLSADDLINDSIIFLLSQNADLSTRIYIEILETKSIDYKRVESSIQKLKLLGFKICIDDFGSGYSNLNHLLNLSIDYLKIDGSIIKEILHDKRAYSIVKTFALFSKENNIEVIAEFIDNKEIIDVLVGFGIDYGQGFYFSKAKPYIDLEHHK